MKKYIVPQSECKVFTGCMLMYTPSDGLGSDVKEKPEKPTPGVTPAF